LNGVHHQLVDFRTLFAVHFDADEMLVHQGGAIFLFKRFVGHDVAPVAGRITYGDEDGLILGAGLSKGLWAPWPPVYRVILMLAEVERALVDQSIRHVSTFVIRWRGATKTLYNPSTCREGVMG
jgi:hypothetical protein